MNQTYELHATALQLIANRLCSAYGIKPVSVVIDGRLVNRYGTAYTKTRRLLISPKLLDYPDELDDTLRHELAHFLAFDVYDYHGHGKVWKDCAVILGARPQTYAPWTRDNKLAGFRYIYECPYGCSTKAARIRPSYEKGICYRHRERFIRRPIS